MNPIRNTAPIPMSPKAPEKPVGGTTPHAKATDETRNPSSISQTLKRIFAKESDRTLVCDISGQEIHYKTAFKALLDRFLKKVVKLNITEGGKKKSIYVTEDTANQILKDHTQHPGEKKGAALAQALRGKIIEEAHKQAKTANPGEKIKLLTIAADQDNAQAQYELGKIYEKDRPEKAIDLYERAGKTLPEAREKLGLDIPAFKNKTSQEQQETMSLLENAAKNGSFKASFFLGHLYEKGPLNDLEKAIAKYKEASQNGSAPAQLALGQIYRYNKEKKDLNEAAKLFRSAAKQRLSKAQYELAIMYKEGQGGLKKSLLRANWLLRRAAAQGLKEAQYELAIMYIDGDWSGQNFTKAARLLTLAANQGLSGAQYHLALMYFYGNGVEKNLAEAARLLTLAANQGLSEAQYHLALMYFTGNGVSQNFTEATKWLKLAAKQEYPDALHHLGILYQDGQDGVPKDTKRAQKLLNRAEELGYSPQQ